MLDHWKCRVFESHLKLLNVSSALRDSKVLNECVQSEVLARHLCCENCILRPADMGPATNRFLIKGNSLTQKYC